MSVSMQSIQNLGLALIAMASGAILDARGYLFLEVFFCTCVCSKCVAFHLCLRVFLDVFYPELQFSSLEQLHNDFIRSPPLFQLH